MYSVGYFWARDCCLLCDLGKHISAANGDIAAHVFLIPRVSVALQFGNATAVLWLVSGSPLQVTGFFLFIDLVVCIRNLFIINFVLLTIYLIFYFPAHTWPIVELMFCVVKHAH